MFIVESRVLVAGRMQQVTNQLGWYVFFYSTNLEVMNGFKKQSDFGGQRSDNSKTMVFISVMSCPWRDKFSKGLFWLILQLFPTSAKIMGNSLTVPEIGQRLQIVYVFYRFTVVANFI